MVANVDLPARPAVVDRCDLRELMSFFPTGVAVVTTVDKWRRPQGMTCSSLVSVCLAPPTLLVSLRTSSTTFQAVLAQGGFAVNLLRAESRPVAELFSGSETDRFGKVRWTLSPRRLPWLAEDSIACADCDLVRTQTVGDHTLVMGELQRNVDSGGSPLLYGMRRYYSLGEPHPQARIGPGLPGLPRGAAKVRHG